MKRLRGQAGIDAAVERELSVARVLGDIPRRVAFSETIAAYQREVVATCRRIVEGEWHLRYASRGERWSDTYALRKAEQDVAETEAIIAALKELQP